MTSDKHYLKDTGTTQEQPQENPRIECAWQALEVYDQELKATERKYKTRTVRAIIDDLSRAKKAEIKADVHRRAKTKRIFQEAMAALE